MAFVATVGISIGLAWAFFGLAKMESITMEKLAPTRFMLHELMHNYTATRWSTGDFAAEAQALLQIETRCRAHREWLSTL
jgi:hypothetical protein